MSIRAAEPHFLAEGATVEFWNTAKLGTRMGEDCNRLMRLLAFLFFYLCSVVCGQGPLTGFDKFVAVISGGISGKLMVPESGPQLPLPILNLQIGSFASGGTTLYAYSDGPLLTRKAGIKKVDLLTGEVSIVPGSELVTPLYGLAVSGREDRIFFAAADANWNCGYYLLSLPEGHVRTVRRPFSRCEWMDASMSPDGTKVIVQGRTVELLDLETEATREIKNYEHLSWSPNGKWIAAYGHRQIVLLNPNTLRKEKSLGRAFDERPSWSPDSKFLLIGSKFCLPYFFSLAILDIQTGKRAEIPSTHCAIQQQGHWVVDKRVYLAQLRTHSQ